MHFFPKNIYFYLFFFKILSFFCHVNWKQDLVVPVFSNQNMTFYFLPFLCKSDVLKNIDNNFFGNKSSYWDFLIGLLSSGFIVIFTICKKIQGC